MKEAGACSPWACCFPTLLTSSYADDPSSAKYFHSSGGYSSHQPNPYEILLRSASMPKRPLHILTQLCIPWNCACLFELTCLLGKPVLSLSNGASPPLPPRKTPSFQKSYVRI